ncbi:AAA family ATPase [Hippea sp. KM1]|uniref:AAA family ATPase n=1 Tax=Hippea sp. KM1 TaxID=944481 RepID=UPI00046D0BBF|nr:AAA family ATPase [Hippea sp. KM1]
MLKSIEIENFLTIERCTIEPSEGLTAIVGESGSGKSLILKAIDSVFSNRVDTGLIGNFSDNAVVKLLFKLNSAQKTQLEVFGIDDDEILLTRTIKRGKSRLLLNHEPITSRVVSTIKDLLIGVVSYDYRAEAFSSKSLLEVIDSLIDSKIKEAFRSDFRQFVDFSEKIKAIRDRIDEIERLHPEVLLDAIERVDPKEGEYEKLLNLSRQIKAISMAKDYVSSIIDGVYAADNGVVDILSRSVNMLEKLRNNGFEIESVDLFSEALEKLNVARYELEEILQRSYQDEDIDRVQSRLFELEKLQRKFSKPLNEIIRQAESLRGLLREKEELLYELETAQKRMDEIERQVLNSAEVLSRERAKEAKRLKQLIGKYLGELLLDKAVVSIDFDRVKLSSQGFDSVSIAFSANPDLKPAPIDKVASGGERSRFILALKRAIADIKSTHQSLLLDEIETGVSGKTLRAVLRLIRDYADRNQVIMITHSDEAKSIADKVYRVEKVFDSQRTKSIVGEE